jgi:hypothetical protein
MSKQTPAGCRDDLALVTHREGEILLLQIEGYQDRKWGVPYGERRAGVDDRERVLQILEELVGTRDAGCIRDTKVRQFFYHSDRDAASNNPAVSAIMHPKRRLYYHIVELYAGDRDIAFGPRVRDHKWIRENEIPRHLNYEDRKYLGQVTENYVIDLDACVAQIKKKLARMYSPYADE